MALALRHEGGGEGPVVEEDPPAAHHHRVEPRPLAWDDLQELPHNEGLRYELVDGVLLVSPAPNLDHQRVVVNLIVLFKTSAPPDLEPFVAPTDWYVTEHTVFEPDLLVVRRSEINDERRLEGTPVLVVEVLSPSTRLRDLGLKKLRYQAEGVPWFWLVDPVGPRLTVLRLEGGLYEEAAVVEADGTYETDHPFSVAVTPGDLLS